MIYAAKRPSLLSLVVRRPMDSLALLAACTASLMIVVNALYLQPGPHPAPIFAVPAPARIKETAVLPRPRPAEANGVKASSQSARPRADLVADMQRELARRGFYDGPVDGILGAKTDAAIRDFEQSTGAKPTGEPSEDLLRQLSRSSVKAPAPAVAPNARPDPLGDLIAPPSKRVVAVQRALSDFGYAPLKLTGTLGPETKAAIEKFERERKLPVTGLISDRLMRELAAMTGRPLE